MIRKKILGIILSVMLIAGAVPAPAFAAQNNTNTDKDVFATKDGQTAGTVYISVYHDGRYVDNTGTKQEDANGDPVEKMNYVPVKMADLQQIDLQDYGLEDFEYRGGTYEKGFDAYAPDITDGDDYYLTVLQLFIYINENYYEGGWMTEITGSAGSMYMKNGFWGHDENLIYYYNGHYPFRFKGNGATADQIPLRDRDYIDVGLFTDWGFYCDANAGYKYFTKYDRTNHSKDSYTDRDIIHQFTMHNKTSLDIALVKSWNDISGENTTGEYKPIEEDDSALPSVLRKSGGTVYAGRQIDYYQDEPVELAEDSKVSGLYHFTPTEEGEYYIWTDGDASESLIDPNTGGNSVVGGPAAAKIRVLPEPEAIGTAKLSKTEYVYNDKAITPAVTVTDGNGKTLVRNTDYTVTYTGNKNVGKATVTIKGTDNYKGRITKTFRIIPKQAVISKLTTGKKKLTVKASSKPSAKGASVYQIAYKQKGAGKWKYKTTTAQSKTIRYLKKGKRYYVKVRAYRTVSNVKYYGAWSKTRLSGRIK